MMKKKKNENFQILSILKDDISNFLTINNNYIYKDERDLLEKLSSFEEKNNYDKFYEYIIQYITDCHEKNKSFIIINENKNKLQKYYQETLEFLNEKLKNNYKKLKELKEIQKILLSIYVLFKHNSKFLINPNKNFFFSR